MNFAEVRTRPLLIFANALSEVIDSRLSVEFDRLERIEYLRTFRAIMKTLNSRRDYKHGQVNPPMQLLD